MLKHSYIFIILLNIISFCLLSSCQTYNLFNKRIDIDIPFDRNDKIAFLLNVNSECDRTNERINSDIYINENIRENKFLIISTYYEFENIIKQNFEFDFITSITPGYFDNHIMVLIILSYSDTMFFDNEQLRVNRKNNYYFFVEQWFNNRIRSRYLHFQIYIIEISRLVMNRQIIVNPPEWIIGSWLIQDWPTHEITFESDYIHYRGYERSDIIGIFDNFEWPDQLVNLKDTFGTYFYAIYVETVDNFFVHVFRKTEENEVQRILLFINRLDGNAYFSVSVLGRLE